MTLRPVYAFGFAWMSLVIMPVFVPFALSRGLTMTDVFTLQAIFGLVMMVLEVPTGYLCDRIGRVRTLLLGSVLNGIGYMLLPWAQGYADFLLMHVLTGAAMSLVSGADVALIYDVLDQTQGTRQQRRRALAHYQSAQVFGEAAASLLGGVLAGVSLLAVAWAQLVAGWVPLVIVLIFLREPRVHGTAPPAWQAARAALGAVVATRRTRLLFVNIVVWGLSTFIAVWLLQPYWQAQGVALGWFGPLWAGTLVTVGVVSQAAPWLERRAGRFAVGLVLTGAPVAAYAGMAAFAGATGIACGFLFYVSRGLNNVHLKEAFNHDLPPRLRATCNSMASGSFRIAFAFAGPLVGIGVDRLGLRGALAGLAIAFLAAFVLLAIPLLRLPAEQG